MRTDRFVAPPRGVVGMVDGWARLYRLGPLPGAQCLQTRLNHSMPGHGVLLPVDREPCGDPRGCLHRSNTSITIMRPRQQRHGGRKLSGSSVVSSSDGAATCHEQARGWPCEQSRQAGRKCRVRWNPFGNTWSKKRRMNSSVASVMSCCRSAPLRLLVVEGDAVLVETDEARFEMATRWV